MYSVCVFVCVSTQVRYQNSSERDIAVTLWCVCRMEFDAYSKVDRKTQLRLKAKIWSYDFQCGQTVTVQFRRKCQTHDLRVWCCAQICSYVYVCVCVCVCVCVRVRMYSVCVCVLY
jgi:hypothetical protein